MSYKDTERETEPPADYEVKIMGEHFDNRKLIATLPIHIQAVKRPPGGHRNKIK